MSKVSNEIDRMQTLKVTEATRDYVARGERERVERMNTAKLSIKLRDSGNSQIIPERL
ncbi:MAG: hypothetical protein F6K17_21355 [Okeania sp. SIO3C4]|nr:hypothetical protein [Okeania sp. SIO3C4]